MKDDLTLALLIISGDYKYKQVNEMLAQCGITVDDKKLTYRSRKHLLTVWAIDKITEVMMLLLPQPKEQTSGA